MTKTKMIELEEYQKLAANCAQLQERLNRQEALLTSMDEISEKRNHEIVNLRKQLQQGKQNQVFFARLIKIIKATVNAVSLDGEDEQVHFVRVGDSPDNG